MGSSSNAGDGKRKKKGRPSLIDLQKRSLRIQQQDRRNPSPNPSPPPPPNPYLRFPSAGRRTTRRNPDPSPAESDSDSGVNRREKKLRLVLRIPNPSSNAGSDAEDRKEERDFGGKATGLPPPRDEPLDSGPTTPLPDKKLLLFVLDRLQKKDTYGVFSDPVDPNELPDYHDIIEHPMDFKTIRTKLSSGDYATLEQFENDVFLISSNAMRYNSSDTIYFRQARIIQELAKKDLGNLRQDSDDNEPKPKSTPKKGRPPKRPVGRPPKRPVGRPPADRAALDVSSERTALKTGANTHLSGPTSNASRKGIKPAVTSSSSRGPYGLTNNRTLSWFGDNKLDRFEESLGASLKYGKNVTVNDENRRDTYLQTDLSPSACVSPILTALDGERKQLLPVGLYMDQVYARSLARFAAKLGPIGWEIASKRIERSLPPGTKFGRGWVGDSEAPPEALPSLPSTSQAGIIPSSSTSGDGPELPDDHQPRALADISGNAGRLSRDPNDEVCVPLDNCSNDTRRQTPLHLGENLGKKQQPVANRLNTTFSFNGVPHNGMNGQDGQQGTFRGAEVAAAAAAARQMAHSRSLDMVSKQGGGSSIYRQTSNMHLSDVEMAVRMVSGSSAATMASGSNAATKTNTTSAAAVLQDPPSDPSLPKKGSSPALLVHHHHQKLHQGSMSPPSPPDLNIRFQPSVGGSPPASGGVLVDPHHPDLALQL